MKIGDVVRLKTISNTPRMVIEAVRPFGPEPARIDCAWFDKNEVLHRDTFDDEVLAPASARDRPVTMPLPPGVMR